MTRVYAYDRRLVCLYFSCLCVKSRYNNSKTYPVLYITSSSFLNPSPLPEDITTRTDALACGIQEYLKSKSIQPTIIIRRENVYSFLFKSKCTTCDKKDGVLSERNDFDLCRFPIHWDKILDHIGDGICIDSPVKIHAYLGWGPRNHALDGDKILLFHAIE